jgi:hypothetical protein
MEMYFVTFLSVVVKDLDGLKMVSTTYIESNWNKYQFNK